MSDITRSESIKQLHRLKADIIHELAFVSKTKDKHKALKSLDMAIASLGTDEAYQLEYERTTNNDLGVDFKLKDYVSREAVRRIIKSPRTQEQMLNALNSLRNATECKAEDCINRDYTAKYVEEFANNEYVSQDEAETIYLIADGIRHIPSALPDVPDNNVGNIDCISRADAIGSIAVECSAEKQDIDYAKFLMLRRAIKALPTVTSHPRWIPVTEDAPPIGTICLWCNKQGSVFTSEITYCSEYISRVGKHGYFCNGPENYGDIVAWMSLPLPWEGE